MTSENGLSPTSTGPRVMVEAVPGPTPEVKVGVSAGLEWRVAVKLLTLAIQAITEGEVQRAQQAAGGAPRIVPATVIPSSLYKARGA